MRYYKLMGAFGGWYSIEDMIEVLTKKQHDSRWLMWFDSDYYISEKYMDENGFLYSHLLNEEKHITI